VNIQWYNHPETMNLLNDKQFSHDPTGKLNKSWHEELIPLSQIGGDDDCREKLQIRMSSSNTAYGWNQEVLASLETEINQPIARLPKIVVWLDPKTGKYGVVCGNHRESRVRIKDANYTIPVIVLVCNDRATVKRFGRADNGKHGARTSPEENVQFAVDEVLNNGLTQQQAMEDYGVKRSDFERAYQKAFVQNQLAGAGCRATAVNKMDSLLTPLYKMKHFTVADKQAVFDGIVKANRKADIKEEQVSLAVDAVVKASGRAQAEGIEKFSDTLLDIANAQARGNVRSKGSPLPAADKLVKSLKEVQKQMDKVSFDNAGLTPDQIKVCQEITKNAISYFGGANG